MVCHYNVGPKRVKVSVAIEQCPLYQSLRPHRPQATMAHCWPYQGSHQPLRIIFCTGAFGLRHWFWDYFDTFSSLRVSRSFSTTVLGKEPSKRHVRKIDLPIGCQ